MKNAVLRIASNDFDENPFEIALTGSGANRAPLAGADTLERHASFSAKVLAATLLANDSDPDGDSLALTSVSAATPAGATVSRSGDARYFMSRRPASKAPAASLTS